MAKMYKLCMQTFEAAKHEDGREYVKEEYKCGKWHTCAEECIYDNLQYIISHPRQQFTLIDEDY
mgnify:CR=1 FL=1